jgi:selenide, water dikinase
VRPADERLIVGFDLADDAGVVRLDAERALVQTVDFFTPVVDDPYLFGAIAAANALSDVYAMGGEPLTALNVLCWDDSLPTEILHEILRGGLDKVVEAGAMLVGGHSVTDKEVKYGLAVTGLVHPDRVWKNQGARPGDVLVLTKPLGSGIATTAMKRDQCPEATARAAVATMAELNRAARDAALGREVHAATDITGFGLVGHAWEMARASGVRLRIRAEAVPMLPGVVVLAEQGHRTRGERSNPAYVGDALEVAASVPAGLRSVLFDPQTSGGLLLSVPPADGAALEGVGVVIGVVEEGPARVILAS